jgi:hypothetical protein
MLRYSMPGTNSHLPFKISPARQRCHEKRFERRRSSAAFGFRVNDKLWISVYLTSLLQLLGN